MRHFPARRFTSAPAGLSITRGPRPHGGLAFAAGLVVGAVLATYAILLWGTPLN